MTNSGPPDARTGTGNPFEPLPPPPPCGLGSRPPPMAPSSYFPPGPITLQAKGSSRPATFSGLVVALIAVPSSLGQFDLFNDPYWKYLVPLGVSLVTNYYIG